MKLSRNYFLLPAGLFYLAITSTSYAMPGCFGNGYKPWNNGYHAPHYQPYRPAYGYPTPPRMSYPGYQPTPYPVMQPTSPKVSTKPDQSSLATDPNTIRITGMQFEKATLTIKKGETITWQQVDLAPHTITANNGEFDSGNLMRGQSFSHTFNEVGTYGYYCRLHPMMKGEIIVTE